MATSSRSFGIDLSTILLDSVKKSSNNLMFFLGGVSGDNIVKNTVEDDSEVWENLELPYTDNMFKEHREQYVPKEQLEYLDYYFNAKQKKE